MAAAAAAKRKQWSGSGSGSSGGGRRPRCDRVVIPVTGVVVVDAAATTSPPLVFNLAPPSIAAAVAVPGKSLTPPPPLPIPPPSTASVTTVANESLLTPPAPLPPSSHSMQERRPPHVDCCPGRRAWPTIATVLGGMLSDPLLPPALPFPPLTSSSRPPWQLEGEMAPRTTPRLTSGGGLPPCRLAPLKTAKSSRLEPTAPALSSAQPPALCQQTG